MLSQHEEVCKLMRTLLNSTCVYSLSRIANVTNQYAYLKSMKRCYYICSENMNGNDLLRMETALLKLRRDTPKTFMRRIELFSNVKDHYMLGIDHSLDIVQSMIARFEKGYAHADEFFVRNILEGSTYED